MRRVDIVRTILAAVTAAATACAPPSLSRVAAPATLTVATYNIRSGNGNLARTAETIRAFNADIVALQEVDAHWSDRSGYADQPAELAAMLGMTVRFAPIYTFATADSSKPPRQFGVALLSRYPILSFHNDTISRLSTQVQNPVAEPMPGLLEATIEVRGHSVRIFNTHLDYRSDPRVRERQVQEMLYCVGDASTPTIVFGDLNATPDAPELRQLMERLHDAWPEAKGAGWTYPAESPVKRIDYVLTSAHFGVVRAAVAATDASDHRPVVVQLSTSFTAR
ncbi:MAG TPA: endonuclease/exonuclease/phosphatase family protein [Gemmatimonadaceae bacterium]|jgi:endonuclease/exonuclease/phosphatase family metal-dependent hydrolase